ncbi:hypothetical protein GEMRC1_000886 [Eukaryota sp. GEM-RC1]
MSIPCSHTVTESTSLGDSLSRPIDFQQSLLVKILTHMQRSMLSWNFEHDCYSFDDVKLNFLPLFAKVGFVSQHFLASTLLSTKLFLETTTISVMDLGNRISQLFSLASFLDAEVQSIFLIMTVSKLLNYSSYSQAITGLSMNWICFDGFDFLNPSSPVYLPHLRILDCHHDLFGDTVATLTTSDFLALFEGLKVNSTVTKIVLTNSDFGFEGAVALAEALKVNRMISNIDISWNSIGNEGAIALAEALKVNRVISRIDLSWNSIGNEGAIALAQALGVNSSVTSIELRENGLGDQFAIALAEVLKVNRMISSVDLYQNSIGNEGVIALAEALKGNSTVAEIILGCNSIGNEGVIALAEALKCNSTISKVCLEYNSIGNESVIALSEVLKINSSITEINLGRNSVSDEGALALAEALGINSTVAQIFLFDNSMDVKIKHFINETSDGRIVWNKYGVPFSIELFDSYYVAAQKAAL